jgi:hypothetical protein
MDVTSIAQEIATHLKGRDDVATAVITEDPDEAAATILVKTQGGVGYVVFVEPAVGDISTESSATE